MFSEGLDVLEPETLIENIHMANYPSVAANATNFREYLKTEVSQGHLLRTKVGFGPIPARVVPVAFIPKPGQPGKFRLISDASAPIGRSTNFATITPPHFYMVNPSDVFYRSDRSTWGCIADADAAFRQLPINPLHAGLLAIEFEGYYYWELRAPGPLRLSHGVLFHHKLSHLLVLFSIFVHSQSLSLQSGCPRYYKRLSMFSPLLELKLLSYPL
ncbi:MAG: hypothetical protein ACXWMO_08320 [Syntrophales bacterium]